ncbi:glycosyltransferase family 4 protein [bacterium]|nr:glycosyltransferase family 4 protein [bacterium]MBU1615318.1 glycosyltransferase family 4 protein [bacterium]
MKKIKVLLLIARLNIGGSALQVIDLTKLLDKEKFEVSLVTGCEGKDEGNMLNLLGEEEVKPILIPELGREISLLDDLKAFAKLFFLIRREKPDIVHTHTAKAGTLGRLAAKLVGAPVIIHTFHGHIFHSYFGPLKTKIFLLIERFLSLFTTRIITISPAQRKEILELGIGNKKKVVCIPLGFDLSKFLDCQEKRGELREELGLSESHLLIGIIARLVTIKGHTYFFEAAKMILDQMKTARFIVVGDGELREEFKELVKKLKIEEATFFLGFRSDLDRVYAGLDLIVLSSLNEGLPTAIIEAMASAKPVVSTRVGGVVDLIEDGVNGLLVPPENPSQLASACLEILCDGERAKKMGREGRRRSSQFELSRLIKDIEVLYEELASANHHWQAEVQSAGKR